MARDEFDVQRFRSTRAYRRFVDRMLHDALEGKRPMSDVAQAAAAAKIGCELFMVEKTLARAGEDREPEAHKDLGDDGGIKMPREVKTFRRKKVTVKTGIGKMGERIDDKLVSIETSAEDRDAEDQAETETLS